MLQPNSEKGGTTSTYAKPIDFQPNRHQDATCFALHSPIFG